MIDARLVVADQVVGANGNAVEIGGGVVRRIGPVEQLRRPGLAEERYPGGVIVPGIVDAHFHPVAYASLLSGLSLKTAVDFDDLSARLRSRADSLDPGAPVTGSRLDDETLAEGRLPTRHDIDGWISDRPVLLHRYCGHVAVANTAALDAAGITAGTVDPTGGSFDRDADGLTGVLRETAIEPVSAALSGSNSVTTGQLVDAMTALAGLGVTSIGAMVGLGDGPWAELGNEVEIVASAARQLPIKLHCFVIANTVDDLRGAAEHLDSAG
ncbi:MAG: amidohydrolase family protein, partial [Acidimicrobiia bacterium]|nr:amidohydrolase family protein [Acidimicrobiia bacterium]